MLDNGKDSDEQAVEKHQHRDKTSGNKEFQNMRKNPDDSGLRYVVSVPDSVEVVTMPQKKRQQNSGQSR